MPSERVKSLLVTGVYDHVYEFWRPLMMALNWIDRRGDTWRFTLWDDPPMLDLALEQARKAGVSLQLIEHTAGEESYRTMHEEPGVGLWE